MTRPSYSRYTLLRRSLVVLTYLLDMYQSLPTYYYELLRKNQHMENGCGSGGRTSMRFRSGVDNDERYNAGHETVPILCSHVGLCVRRDELRTVKRQLRGTRNDPLQCYTSCKFTIGLQVDNELGNQLRRQTPNLREELPSVEPNFVDND